MEWKANTSSYIWWCGGGGGGGRLSIQIFSPHLKRSKQKTKCFWSSKKKKEKTIIMKTHCQLCFRNDHRLVCFVFFSLVSIRIVFFFATEESGGVGGWVGYRPTTIYTPIWIMVLCCVLFDSSRFFFRCCCFWFFLFFSFSSANCKHDKKYILVVGDHEFGMIFFLLFRLMLIYIASTHTHTDSFI